MYFIHLYISLTLNMLKRIVVLLLFVQFSFTQEKNTNQHKHNDNPSTNSKKILSPLTQSMISIKDTHLHIEYSSPSVRNRIIFGGLLAFNEVWQAGAHNATWIDLDNNIKVDGKVLKKGKYGIFIIPRKDDSWTVIFNSRWKQHGKDDYDESEDVLRVEVKPIYPNEFSESLKYTFKKKNKNTATLSIEWEYYKLELPVSS